MLFFQTGANIAKSCLLFDKFVEICSGVSIKIVIFGIDMTKRTVIALCIVIAILAGIIAVCVWSLYSGVYISAPAVQRQETAVVKDTAVQQQEPVQAQVVPEAEAVVAKETPVKDTLVPEGPFKVKNCGTGKANTICQNEDHSIELKDENGRTLWKKSLGSVLCGKVGEVDFFKNGKIQFLLVEGRNVHLLDRFGREVRGFPRILPYNAVLGPEKISVKGTNYWKVVTDGGTLYLNLKKNLILTELPK